MVKDLIIDDFEVMALGHKLGVRTIGHVHGDALRRPVLVFLHDGLGCISLWRDFPEVLASATGCDVLLYDRWGHGRSDPLVGGRSPDFFDEEAFLILPDILRQLDIKRTILIGHSDGGSIAFLFAAKYPDKVEGIIVESTHVFVEEVTLQGIRNIVDIYQTTDLKQKLAKYHGEKTDTMFHGWAEVWLSPEFRSWHIKESLSAITCPVLVIQGADDEYGTTQQVKEIETRVKSVRSLLIPECGHVPHHQARDKVLEEMFRFIGDLV